VLALGAGAALAQDINVNYVPGKDFSGYKTYKWVEIQAQRSPTRSSTPRSSRPSTRRWPPRDSPQRPATPLTCSSGYQVAVNQERQWNSYSTGGYGRGGTAAG